MNDRAERIAAELGWAISADGLWFIKDPGPTNGYGHDAFRIDESWMNRYEEYKRLISEFVHNQFIEDASKETSE